MSVNRVILVGNIGKDAELKTINDNFKVASFSLATSDSYTNKSGEKITSTEWHNIVCWNKLAEIAGKYIKKGGQLYVEGKIKNESYEKDGVKHYITKIEAQSFTMLGSKPSAGDYQAKESALNKLPQSEYVDSNRNETYDDNLPF